MGQCCYSPPTILAFDSEEIEVANETNIMSPEFVFRHSVLNQTIALAPESITKTMLLNSTPTSVNYTTTSWLGMWFRVRKVLFVHIRAEKTLRELFRTQGITPDCEIGLDYGQNFTLSQLFVK